MEFRRGRKYKEINPAPQLWKPTLATMALISMLRYWSLGINGTGPIVGTVVFDHHKAVDFTDHNILIVV